MTRRSQLDICWLQISMHDPFLMCRFKSLTDVCRNVQGCVDWNWPSPDALCQRVSLNQLQDKKPRAIGFIQIIDGCDIGVVERCQHFSFALKSCYTFRISAELVRQDFDGDFAFELRVTRSVDLTLPPLPSKAVIS